MGAKSRAASLVWDRFGDPAMYLEPFCGSAAVLLARPIVGKHEVINDFDCMVANFWRAARWAPVLLAQKATSLPPCELTLTARHRAMYEAQGSLAATLAAKEDAYDIELAASWVWALNLWIGKGFMTPKGAYRSQMPRVSGRNGIHAMTEDEAISLISAISCRLRQTAILHGDWKRLVAPSFTDRGNVAVFLDPPYADGDFTYAGVGKDAGVNLTAEVTAWAIAHPEIKICVAGYEGTTKFPAGWEEVPWTATGGLANTGDGDSAGSKNRFRERLWFSPACLRPAATGFEF
jgi:site-specific DNA-adenine methylase